jgi:cytochrome P450
MIIASAGFGHKISWAEDSVNEPPTGYKLTFRAALTEAIRLMFVRVLAPTWAYYLPIPKLHSALSLTTLAYEELGRYLKDMIKEAREAGVGEKVDADDESAGGSKKADLFRRLIAANEAEVGKLSEDELTSNVYVRYIVTLLFAVHLSHSRVFQTFLLAGHGKP